MNNLFSKTSCASMLARSSFTSRQFIRYCSSTTKDTNNDDWRVIYKLPIVRLASAFNRLKIYQAGLAAACIPAAEMLVSMGEVPPQTTYVAATIGVTGLITLTTGSLFLKNLVGLIYINKAEDQIKLAYVDFWGRRKHKVMLIDDLIPEWELPRSRLTFYQPITTRSNDKENFKLIHRLGVVTEKTAFASIFGD